MSYCTAFNPHCTRCPRLKRHLSTTAKQFPHYHCKPVPAFGDPNACLLIVGLAPGLHGANASGRVFTGDASGDLLFETLFALGFSNQCNAHKLDDALILSNCRITNAVKCLPPENKPNSQEINNCKKYLMAEINTLSEGAVIFALGKIAHDAILGALALTKKHHPFTHGAVHKLMVPTGKQYQLVDSYHCSRYNLTTKRLSPDMFKAAMDTARRLLPV